MKKNIGSIKKSKRIVKEKERQKGVTSDREASKNVLEGEGKREQSGNRAMGGAEPKDAVEQLPSNSKGGRKEEIERRSRQQEAAKQGGPKSSSDLAKIQEGNGNASKLEETPNQEAQEGEVIRHRQDHPNTAITNLEAQEGEDVRSAQDHPGELQEISRRAKIDKVGWIGTSEEEGLVLAPAVHQADVVTPIENPEWPSLGGGLGHGSQTEGNVGAEVAKEKPNAKIVQRGSKKEKKGKPEGQEAKEIEQKGSKKGAATLNKRRGADGKVSGNVPEGRRKEGHTRGTRAVKRAEPEKAESRHQKYKGQKEEIGGKVQRGQGGPGCSYDHAEIPEGNKDASEPEEKKNKRNRKKKGGEKRTQDKAKRTRPRYRMRRRLGVVDWKSRVKRKKHKNSKNGQTLKPHRVYNVRNLSTIQQQDKNNSILTKTQEERLGKLIEEYNEVFSETPGRSNKYKHKLKIYEDKPFIKRSYPIPINYRKQVQQEIDVMLANDIIERSRTPYINPMVMVLKPDKSIRLCLDARRLNDITVPDYESAPAIDEILRKGRCKRYISKIDLTSSFWQIPLTHDSKKYTGFLFNNKVYNFKVVPFGLQNSLAALVRTVDLTLGQELEENILAYVDDLLCLSETFEEHLEHLRTIFTKFREGNLTINPRKTFFCQEEVKFLGYIFTQEGVRTDPEKLQAIHDFPVPKNKKQLQSFLGFVNYYARFTSKYSQETSPLLKLLRKQQPWIWNSDMQAAFDRVKGLFLEAVTITHPKAGQDVFLQTDASHIAIASQLYQKDDNGDLVVIGFASRTLKKAELSYSVCEKELLAIVHGLKKFRPLILGAPLHIITDNKALQFLNTCNFTNSRITRWTLAIQEYQPSVIHCPGKENIPCDTVSRMYQAQSGIGKLKNEQAVIRLNEMKSERPLRQIILSLKEGQREQIDLNNITENIQRYPRYEVIEGYLCFKVRGKNKIVIPEGNIEPLINEVHQVYLHIGRNKLAKMLGRSFYIKNMYQRVMEVIRRCKICQYAKHTNRYSQALTRPILTQQPGEMVAVDFLGPLPRSIGGARHVLVILDVFSKFLKLYAVKSPNSKTSIDRMTEYFNTVGKPIKILTDFGAAFTSKQWKEWIEAVGVRHILIPVRHPQVNLAERINRDLGRILRTYCSNAQSSWQKYLQYIEKNHNQMPHEITGYTPAMVHWGVETNYVWEGYIPEDCRNAVVETRREMLQKVFQRIRTKGDYRAARTNRTCKETHFQVNDLVLITRHNRSNVQRKETEKLLLIYEGPFKITRKLGRKTYEVANIVTNKVRGRYDVKDIKLYVD